MVQSIESNGADDTVNASDPGDFPFGEELIIAALDALLETLTPGRHAPPQILPSTPDPRPVISVEADLLHDAVVSLCLPAFKGGDKGAAKPDQAAPRSPEGSAPDPHPERRFLETA